ncbi:RrF2 family transcriptional regulator [Marinirhabdus gelatinilytica]|uniref:BadM/Rrf2 family transcriptional regulator n=1 Tax=Marinirhabdus gelatinilytica TaxID=1703343 RepID=A0A370QLK6_9FLAO|nr:Rrf2 family transcriptional regulator [Marinirhabdus gelatinilytica]RDK89246.1 BadM/Rrf2 family transcriptional regulator [Marinirhabdus gelatinilytica]
MLSRKTKYGLKALSYLARENSDDPVQIVIISEAENISQKFLESILLILKKAEILQSKKGKGGGYFLAKPASEITIASVLRVLEGPIALVPYVSLNFYQTCDDCPDEEACSVHKLMVKVRDTNLNIFENTTLADLVDRKPKD